VKERAEQNIDMEFYKTFFIFTNLA